jgi:hypothetical protein
MLWRTMYPANYLAADDLPDGKDFTWTISAVAADDLEQVSDSDKRKKERKLVISFAELDAKAEKKGEKPKRYIPCKTVARLVGRAYGQDTESWLKKQLTLFRTTCTSFGDPETPCVRITDPRGRLVWEAPQVVGQKSNGDPRWSKGGYRSRKGSR